MFQLKKSLVDSHPLDNLTDTENIINMNRFLYVSRGDINEDLIFLSKVIRSIIGCGLS